MAKESKRKQLHYRRAEFLSPTGRTLQSLMEEALRKLTPIKTRFEMLSSHPDDSDLRRFINTHRSAMGMEFGVMVLLAYGQNKLIIETNENQDELDTSQLSAPNDMEFLESILYYGIFDNHVILLQSMAIRARELESHLNWVLRESKIIDEQNAVFLNNFVPDVIYDKIEKNDVKSVKVGTPLYDEVVAAPAHPDTRLVSFRHRGIGIEVLSKLIPNRINDIDFSDMGDTTNIEVFVEVTYNRKTDEQSQDALNNITAALRHTSEDDIKIELKNGSVIKGSELTIKTFKNIESWSGVLNNEDVFNNMQYWIEELLEQGLVAPD